MNTNAMESSNFYPLKDHGYSDLFSLAAELEERLRTASIHPADAVKLRLFAESALFCVIESKLNASKTAKISKQTLEQQLTYLQKHWPNCWVLSSLHRLRLKGNKAAHKAGFQLEFSEWLVLLRNAFDIQRWVLEEVKNVPIDFPFSQEIYTSDSNPKSAPVSQPYALSSDDVPPARIDSSNIKLGPQQEKLACLFEGRHFLNAPPGTGKTQLLTERVARLYNRFSSAEIICLTFTNRAASEMQNRVKQVLPAAHDVFVGNIHAFCNEFLRTVVARQHAEFRNFGILDERFEKELLEDDFKGALKSPQEYMITPQGFPKELSEAYCKATEPSRLLRFLELDENSEAGWLQRLDDLAIPHILLSRSRTPFLREMAAQKWGEILINSAALNQGWTYSENSYFVWRLLEDIQARHRRSQSLSFNGLIGWGLVFLEEYARKYDCIQVDEVQDINAYQWALIRLLSKDSSHVFAVGDTDQSIYRFLGADSDLLTEYTNSFTNHSLDRNYRSTPTLVRLLNRYRKANFAACPPDMEVSHSEPEDSHATLLVGYENEHMEMLGIVSAVNKVLGSGDRDIGILFRYNRGVDEAVSLLEQNGIPAFRVSQRDLMKHPVILDFISMLAIHSGRASRLDWYRLCFRAGKSSKQGLRRRVAARFVDELAKAGISPALALKQVGFTGQDDSIYEHLAKYLVRLSTDGRVIVFDTETTSKDTNHARLLQLAAIAIEGGKVVAEFNEFIRLEAKEFTPELQEAIETTSTIHHITLDQLAAEGKQAGVVFSEFVDFIGEDGVLVAHNLPYDLAVLSKNLQLTGFQSVADRYFASLSRPMFDTLAISRLLFPQLTSYTLENLLRELKLEGVNSHNAIDDVRATANLFLKIASTLEERLKSIDDTLSRYESLTKDIQEHLPVFLNNLWYQDVFASRGECACRLSDLLYDWLDYAEHQGGWYTDATFGQVRVEAENKLGHWMDENIAPGRLCDLLVTPDVMQMSLMSEIDLINPDKDRVVVSTIHRAKGLAFNTVLVPQVVDDIYPGFHAIKGKVEKQIAEDARLLYVALSRSTHKLIVTYHHRNRAGYGKRLSRFLDWEAIKECFVFKRDYVGGRDYSK